MFEHFPDVRKLSKRANNSSCQISGVVAYGKGTVEVHGGSIVNNGDGEEGRYSCVHTSGNQHSDGAKYHSEKIINKAKISCENSNINVFEQLVEVDKLSKRANNTEVMIILALTILSASTKWFK